jgi:hypothetical protein
MTHKWIATALLAGNTPFADEIVKKSSGAQSQEVHSVLTCGSHDKSEHVRHSAIFPNTHPHIKARRPAATTQKNITRHTGATSEDNEWQFKIRQRSGCKITSSYSENWSAPSAWGRVEDVHSVVEGSARCAK